MVTLHVERSFRATILLFALLGFGSMSGALAQPVSQQQPAEKTVDQVNKNIKVFKGMPASKLGNTMLFMRYSLGVSCNFCHVNGQWEQDVKPAKAKTREMIQMVFDINKKFFEGRNEVNCYTCHQGSRIPRTEIMSIRLDIDSMMRPKRPMREEAGPTFPPADQVISKFIDVIGGRDTLSRITSTIEKGSLITSGGIIVTRETYQAAPDKRLDVRHLGNRFGDLMEGFDGTVAWRKDNRGSGEKSGEQFLQAKMDAEFNHPLKIKDLYSKLSVIGIEQLGAGPAYVMSGTSIITGKREQLYFGTESGLLLRRSIVTDNILGAIMTDVYYEEYRTFDGIRMPTLISEFNPDSGTITKISDVEHNVSIDKEKFSIPSK